MKTPKQSNLRIGAVAHIAGVGRTALVKWIERGAIRLSVDKHKKETLHRRLPMHDVLKVGLIGKLSQYGMEVRQADETIEALLEHEQFVVYVAHRENPMTGESIMNSLRGVVWTFWRDGDKWHHIASNKPAAEEDLESYLVIHAGKIIDRILTRFKAHTDPYYGPIADEIEKSKEKKS